MVTRPCECKPASIPREMRVKDIIAHPFDCHVMEKQNWTLDQLASWVGNNPANQEFPEELPTLEAHAPRTQIVTRDWLPYSSECWRTPRIRGPQTRR